MTRQLPPTDDFPRLPRRANGLCAPRVSPSLPLVLNALRSLCRSPPSVRLPHPLRQAHSGGNDRFLGAGCAWSSSGLSRSPNQRRRARPATAFRAARSSRWTMRPGFLFLVFALTAFFTGCPPSNYRTSRPAGGKLLICLGARAGAPGREGLVLRRGLSRIGTAVSY